MLGIEGCAGRRWTCRAQRSAVELLHLSSFASSKGQTACAEKGRRLSTRIRLNALQLHREMDGFTCALRRVRARKGLSTVALALTGP